MPNIHPQSVLFWLRYFFGIYHRLISPLAVNSIHSPDKLFSGLAFIILRFAFCDMLSAGQLPLSYAIKEYVKVKPRSLTSHLQITGGGGWRDSQLTFDHQK